MSRVITITHLMATMMKLLVDEPATEREAADRPDVARKKMHIAPYLRLRIYSTKPFKLW